MSISQSIKDKLNASVPRYTSYPTAPHFKPDIGEKIMDKLIADIQPDQSVSLYFHIPYCDRLCWFCGCHTKQTKKYDPVKKYVDSLVAELAIFRESVGFKARISHIHFGGGSPSLLREEEAIHLNDAINSSFIKDENTEVSIEIDPSDVNEDTLKAFAALGMTRASIGVQDFDPKVQKAINRPQGYDITAKVVKQLRDMGVQSLNIDALYGLPYQTLETIEKTTDLVIKLSPDRIALFGYAHVPWVKKHQNLIPTQSLPDSQSRFEQMEMAKHKLISAGYIPVGIDHFAKQSDGLVQALNLGELKRNFQGYTTDTCKTLIGFGASSISYCSHGYVQNTVATGQYQHSISQGKLSASRGYDLNLDDKIRAAIIESLMCNFSFSFEDIETKFGDAAKEYISEAKTIAADDIDNMCFTNECGFYVHDFSKPLVRHIASQFDRYLLDANVRYSKAV